MNGDGEEDRTSFARASSYGQLIGGTNVFNHSTTKAALKYKSKGEGDIKTNTLNTIGECFVPRNDEIVAVRLSLSSRLM